MRVYQSMKRLRIGGSSTLGGNARSIVCNALATSADSLGVRFSRQSSSIVRVSSGVRSFWWERRQRVFDGIRSPAFSDRKLTENVGERGECARLTQVYRQIRVAQ